MNARDYNHCTALHFAAFEGHLECVKLIASNKDCDIHCVDKVQLVIGHSFLVLLV